MYKDHRITVVAPCRNEAAHIAEVIGAMPAFVDHIIVVDDCSTDNTAIAAEECGDRRVVILRTESNQGVGGATILGYQKGLELASDVLVKMDGDGQMPAEYLPDLLDAIVERDFDYAKGNRWRSCPNTVCWETSR
jgi:glycosyltransferase involved in cell wall biosynthesis